MKAASKALSNKSRFVVFGLTGLPGSGKGEFVTCARSIAQERDSAFHYYSLSDVLRGEAKRQGKGIDRDHLNRLGNELRAKFGNGALSTMILPSLFHDLEQTSNSFSICVVDAIRTPEEIQVLRETLGDRFCMVALTAKPETLISRIQARARNDESKEALKSRRGAEDLLQREFGTGQPQFGLNISRAIESADYSLPNTGTLDQFKKAVIRFLSKQLS